MNGTSSGKIFTFYSYKGGTGRSMALANVAWILASNGKRVLVLDWDLEAPGLHTYFRPFLVDKDLTDSEGIIDFVIDFQIEAMTPSDAEVPKDWYKPHANILRYAAALKDWDFGNGGLLDFVPAGRQGTSYSTRVNSFDWQNFYTRLGGWDFLEAAREKMKEMYDYILIDSRTGVSDTSGICTVQMPDILVVCFTLNNQSIEGAAAVANSVYEQRQKSGEPVQVFPVPMRIDDAETDKLDKRLEHAKDKFDSFPAHMPSGEREQYWSEVAIPYVPYYAYEEILAVFKDRHRVTNSLLPPMEKLTDYLIPESVKLVHIDKSVRDDIVAQYEGKADEPEKRHHFISYSPVDAEDFAIRLHDELSAEPAPIPAWLDRRDLSSVQGDFEDQIVEAIRTCQSLIFVMTRDSVESESICKREWLRALKYKKPVILLLLHPDAEAPYLLANRHYIDFTGGDFDAALAELRGDLHWLASPEGQLAALKDRVADARRDLRRANNPEQRARIQDEIDFLQGEIEPQQRVVENPQEAERRVEERIQDEQEREREPEKKPANATARARFINPPPVTAPRYFQDRHVETELIGDFLEDDALRLMSVVGRRGIGKTAMVCRLLKSLESGRLPDDGGTLNVDGIVYLSEVGSHRVTVDNLYTGLCRLLPEDVAGRLENIYKDPQFDTEAEMRALLDAFPDGRYVLLLDNFESVLDPETHKISDAELDEALCALLSLPHHAVKVIMTTRFAPRDLALVHPGRQVRLLLDEGLPSPYAENVLRGMDVDGKLGLKTAPEEMLDEARRRTGGNPRALEHLFAILSVDRDISLREVLDDTELLPENMVEILVGEAFGRLDPTAQMVMQALAVYARPVSHTAVDYLLQPHQLGVESRPVLKRLVNMQLVRKEAGHYHMHEVDRAYALSRVARGEVNDREETEAPPFTQFALLHRAANYFEEIRTPKETWRTIEDLAPQLAEFELRYAGQDYDKAARVLLEIDFDHLLLWGHSRLAIELHERLQGKLNYPDPEQSSVGNLGTAYQNMGQVQRAIGCHKQALNIAREIGDRRGEGNQLGNLGNCYSNLGQIERAIEHHNQALVISREIGDRRSEGNQLGGLGNCYSDLGQIERAMEHYQQALYIAREIGDRGSEGFRLGNLGNLYETLGQTERAIDHYQQALDIAREIGDRGSEGVWLGYLGNCYARLGQTALAMDYYQHALYIAREIQAKQLEGNELGNLGNLYSDLGQTERAMEHYQQALVIAREIANRHLEGALFSRLGDCYYRLGQTERAMEHYQQALVISREIGAKQLEGNTLGNLSTCYSTLGQTERAIDHYQQALEIAREISDRGSEGVWLGNLGNSYSVLGQIERAIAHYEQALLISREIGYRRGEGTWLSNLGNCYSTLGQTERAIEHHELALEIAREIGDRRGEGSLLGNLGLAYLYAGDLTAARAGAEAARQYDEPQNNDNVRVLLGVIALRQGEQSAAQEAFEAAVAQAEALLSYSEQNYNALDSKGLALCGLALCKENSDYISAAKDAYRSARAINKDTGIVEDVLRLFDALVQADPAGMLTEVRAAAAGE